MTLWSHGGTSSERDALQRSIEAFETAHHRIDVIVELVTEGDYNDRLQAAAVEGRLPDLIDIDGPLVAAYAYQGVLAPLDDLVSDSTIDSMLPSLRAQGTWDDQLWAVGTFESGLGLFASRSRLRRAGVRIPTGVEDAWTGAEFDAALTALAALDDDGAVLDLKQNYGAGEWLTYGFAPLLYSAGGGLFDVGAGQAAGSLDSPASIDAVTALVRWAQFADPNEDDRAFIDGRVALSWVGHWEYPRYAEALGSDLALVPLPDLGHGSKSGRGSWAWSVSAQSAHRREAAEVIDWFATTEQILATIEANGAVPGSQAAIDQSPKHRDDSPLHLYAQQLDEPCSIEGGDDGCIVVARPITPGYPTLTTAFSLAVQSAMEGEDPGEALRRAAADVDADQSANDGYRRRDR